MKSITHIKLFCNYFIAILAIVSVFSSYACNNDKKDSIAISNNENSEYNLKNYYYPLNEKIDTLIYKYKVITKDKDGEKESFEYMIWTKMENGDFVSKTKNENNILIDSSVFRIKNDGVYYEKNNFYLIDGSHVKTNVKPKLLFSWKNRKGDSYYNLINFSYYFGGEFIKAKLRRNVNFIGLETVKNLISNEVNCAHYKVEYILKLTKPKTGDTLNYVSESDLYNLKGIGLYKATKKTIYGSSIMELVEIIRD